MLSVIVPVFNERLTVRALIERVRAVPIRKQIIIVDDCSTDGTADVIRAIADEPADGRNTIEVLFHAANAGKGAAIRTAIPAVRGDIALIQDADLEYDPNEYPILVQPILDGHADVVFGSRFLSGPHRVLFFRHMIGNRILTLLSNLCTDLNLTDMETCYKVFRADVLKRLHLTSNRFGIEPEITAKVARLGCRVYEVPISYHGREYWEGKKIGWKDGVSAVWTILKHAVVDDLADSDPAYATLRRLRRERRYTEWVWSQVQRCVGDRVLEAGSGIGSYTGFLRNRAFVLATDRDPAALARLRERFAGHANMRFEPIDWAHPDVAALQAHGFDTVLCLNVHEPLARDDDALATVARLLPPGGRLVLQVPALGADAAGRDARAALTAQLARHGWQVESARYCNLPGALGWWLNTRLLRRRPAADSHTRLAGTLVPLLSLEQYVEPPTGLALLVVARRSEAAEGEAELREQAQ